MSKTMRAVLIEAYGDNDVIRIEEVARPEPDAGELLVKVRAAGVNPIDWKIRDGAGERLGLTLPIHMGGELVGDIVELGEGVQGFEPSETIFGMVHTGAFAEYAAVPAADMVRAPGGQDAVRAAAFPLAGSTAWQALFDVAGLTAGQRLLITNSSGGVGSLAVQFAKAAGAHVTAMASARNEAFVRGLGADDVIDYARQPVEEAARDMDVVFDTVGGDTFQRAFQTLKTGGFMVTVVAFPEGEAERYGVRVARSFTRPNARNLADIRDLAEAGKIAAHIDSVFAFPDIKEALARSQSGGARGKIVLEVS